jgi:hypothetical protein
MKNFLSRSFSKFVQSESRTNNSNFETLQDFIGRIKIKLNLQENLTES